jgi:hypothetical protein
MVASRFQMLTEDSDIQVKFFFIMILIFWKYFRRLNELKNMNQIQILHY